MAEKSAKKRQLKKVETVRQRAERSTTATPQVRRVKATANKASRPFRAFGRGIAKVLRPFAFVLIPFKTRPARFIGRLLQRGLFIGFFIESWKEVRQVEWPDLKTTIRLSIAVFIFSVLFGVIVTVIDFGMDKVFREVFIK